MKKNDILTPIGLVLAIGFIFFAIAQGKGGVGMFIDIPSFLITVGGSFAAVLITFDLDTVKRIPSALKMSIVSPRSTTWCLICCCSYARRSRLRRLPLCRSWRRSAHYRRSF